MSALTTGAYTCVYLRNSSSINSCSSLVGSLPLLAKKSLRPWMTRLSFFFSFNRAFCCFVAVALSVSEIVQYMSHHIIQGLHYGAANLSKQAPAPYSASPVQFLSPKVARACWVPVPRRQTAEWRPSLLETKRSGTQL